MSSLSAHLRLPEDHSGLPFHPSCPICRRDRLAGSLEGDEIVSRRTQAALAAGLLVFSGIGAPAAAVAAGPDQDVDGSAEVVASPDPVADIDETTTGWTDSGTAPVEEQPAAVVPEPEDGSMEAAEREPVEEPLVEATDETEEATSEPVALAAPPTEDPTATSHAPESAATDGVRMDTAVRAKREPTKRTKRAVLPRVIAAPAPVVAPTTTNAVTVRVVAGANEKTVAHVTSGARFHVVQRGESLWSIASDRLGEQAGAAQIAREVDRLWQLNEDRIASGSPDLLYTGTRLRLR
jgi:LysM domain